MPSLPDRSISVGVALPTRFPGPSGSVLLEWARRAEAGPFSTLAVPDRVVFDALEPLVALASVVGVTQRVRLMTSILLGPTRETSLLARQSASLDVLSGGRFTLALGVGIREDDYAASGTDFHARGRALDDQLARLHRIWAGGEGIGPAPASRSGPAPASAGAPALGSAPAPASRSGPASGSVPAPESAEGRPEVLLGGYVDAVARRIATWGDGFMAPGGGDPERMRALWARILRGWAAAGRPGRPRLVGGTYFSLGPSAVEAARAHIDAWYGFNPELAERRLAGIPTSEDAVRASIVRQREAGADEIILRPVAGDLDALDRLAELADGLRVEGIVRV